MALVRYRIDSSRSKIVVMARSSVHDTETVWSKMSGYIEVDPENPSAGATAVIDVDMSEFDAGDWLKNRKLKKDLDVSRYPKATFTLDSLADVKGDTARTEAKATGTIDWRTRKAKVEATGHASLSASEVQAEASFDLDVRDVGVKPPKILMFKVEEVVSVKVELRASA
ncbi:MAG: YceI family protein [Deltaproteobacteria bacterium]|jgi:polyisoprenoid-binding protein YceI|nr:YceI family protein [Deltaproteobacteria bacterium]